MSDEIGAIQVESRYHNGEHGETTYHLIGEFPPRIAFADAVFNDFNPELVKVEGDEIAITLTDARATYRIVERRAHMADVLCELVASEGEAKPHE